ncbi:MAG: serine/threonine protein kinase, partial [Polyangiaceae bacterium]|nr:serine/threonine protein kinase [Polyangiaceae bacterium]
MTEGGLAGPRYAAFDEIGAGGMATVHLGRQIGAAGFSKTVAIKRLRPEHVRDAEFVAMFADEARLAARVRHPNVVQTLDVVGEGGELFLVLEYVHGESLEALVEGARALGERAPPDVASALVVGVLAGLQAAHVAKADGGAPLELVHRDVSPHNVLVGADGVARLIDFGIAQAAVRLRSTRDGKLMGKLPYMAPEQLEGDGATPLSDLYSAGVVLWELLAGRRLFEASSEGALLAKILAGRVPPLASYAPALPPALGELVARALSREPGARFASAHEMAVALELALPPASPRKVGEWVERVAQPQLARRAERIAAVERETAAAPSLFAGAARVTISPEGRPGAVPELAFPPAPLPLAPARRTGPDGETMTMTAPRAPQRLPHAEPAAAPSPP